MNNVFIENLIFNILCFYTVSWKSIIQGVAHCWILKVLEGLGGQLFTCYPEQPTQQSWDPFNWTNTIKERAPNKFRILYRKREDELTETCFSSEPCHHSFGNFYFDFLFFFFFFLFTPLLGNYLNELYFTKWMKLIIICGGNYVHFFFCARDLESGRIN